MDTSSIQPFKTLIIKYKENFFVFNYVFFSIAFVVGLSTGEIIMSVATISLVLNWILEGQFKQKLKLIKERNYVPFILAFGYVYLLIWLLNSSDLSYALRDLKIKLPILFFPLVLGTINFSRKVLNLIFKFFILGVLFSIAISLLVYLEFIPIKNDISDVRNISIFISHIRLSLLVCFSIALLVYFWSIKESLFNKFFSVVIILFFIYFLFLLQAFTGIFILIALIALMLFFFLIKKGNNLLKLGVFMGFVIISLFSFLHVYSIYKNNFIPKPIKLSELDYSSASGEIYQHRLEDNWLENGNRVWLYIAPLELEESWNLRSDIPFDSLDIKGQPMWGTLYRFLTSKGFRKDKEGIGKLTNKEISIIESGQTNCCEKLTGFDRRIKEVIFEYERFMNGEDPNGHSFIQRIIYLKAGADLFSANLELGVGIGDVHDEFMNYYEKNNSKLRGENRKRVHNQYMSLAVGLGVFGLIIWLFVFYSPYFIMNNNRRLYFYFLLIISISFLTDNTLERQAGVMFFAFFNSLLLFHKIEEKL